MKIILALTLMLSGCAKSGMTEQQLRQMFPKPKPVASKAVEVQTVKPADKHSETTQASIAPTEQCSIVMVEADEENPEEKVTMKELKQRYDKLQGDNYFQQKRLEQADEYIKNDMEEQNKLYEENKELKAQVQKLLVERSR